MQQQPKAPVSKGNRQTFSYSPRRVTETKLRLHTKQSLAIASQLQQSQIQAASILSKSQIIYNIHVGEDMIIIVSHIRIVIYSLLTMKIIYEKKGKFWDAKAIPFTTYLLCVISQEEQNQSRKQFRQLKILDMDKDLFIGTIKLKMVIQQIKTGHHCIAAGNPLQLAVFHFPSLKPICHEPAGNGLMNIFDISYQGLTIAYQYQKRGILVIHNFSNQQMNRAQRIYSRSDMSMAEKQSAVHSNTGSTTKSSNLKSILQIKAHKQHISMIKLSPNGSRVATASNKGTIIRIFLTSSGKLWQQLRVGYEIHKVLDIHFSEQGNILACLNQLNTVYLYNLKLQPFQQMYQSHKRGYKIYQQANPKSYFSMLSIFYRDFGHQYPFAHYKLEKPKSKQEEEKSNDNKKQDKEDPNRSSDISDKMNDSQQKQEVAYMPVVLQEEEHDHGNTPTTPQQQMQHKLFINKQKQQELDFESDKGENNQKKDNIIQKNKTSNDRNSLKPVYIQQREQNNQRNFVKSNSQQQVNQITEEQQMKRTSSNMKNPYISSKLSSKRSISDMSINHRSNLSSLGPKPYISRKQKSFISKVFNTVSRIYVGGNNLIWAVKGHYIFIIKYDPFNGGQMYHKTTINFTTD